MSVADQINRIKTNIANTYTAAQSKGATMPQTQNSDNLAACVQSITTGGGGGTQFGLTVEQMLGTLDSEGNLTVPLLPSITFAGVKNISSDAYSNIFYGHRFVDDATISFPDLTNIDSRGMQYGFYDCNLTGVDLSSLVSVGMYGLNYCFGNNNLLTVDLPSLTTVNSFGLQYCFYTNRNLTTVTVPSLTEIGTKGMECCFAFNNSLTNISFPSLTSVQTNSFGSVSYAYCFLSCLALTEIHFRADMQATIEAMDGYADKWGATNATIYFDL